MSLPVIKEKLTEIKAGIEEILQLSDDDIINNIDQDIKIIESDVNSLYVQFVDIHRQMFDPDGEYYMRENKKNKTSMFSQILKEEAEKRKPIDSYELDHKIEKAADALLKLYKELKEHGVNLEKIGDIYHWLKKQTPVTITTAPHMAEDVKIHADARDEDKQEAAELAQKTKQDVKLVTEVSDNEKRYRVILNGYLWANNNKQAVALAEQYKKELDQKQDGKFKTEVFDLESKEKIYPLRETVTELSKKEALTLLKENKKRKVKEVKTKAKFLKEINNNSYDPTKKEMVNALTAYFMEQYSGLEDMNFYIEEAIYWFAYDYHSGQWSNLYSALSSSKYKPSRSMTNISDADEISQAGYKFLVKKYES